MTNKKERKRLALTANKMPEEIYQKLEKLGSDRKLTPYIVSLMEKEDKIDKILESFSSINSEVADIKNLLIHIDNKLEGNPVPKENKSNDFASAAERETIEEGEINISSNIIGGIEEDTDEIDF